MSASSTPLVDCLINSKDWIKIKDKSKVENVLRKLIEGGHKSLQFVVDFDFTLTRSKTDDGELGSSTFYVMERFELLPEEYKERSKVLFDKYHTVEVDHKMTIEEKIPYMVEWYKLSNELLQSLNVTRDMFPAMLENSNLVLRKNAELMLNTLSDKEVPCLVMSAGLGDIVHEALKQKKLDNDNVKIVSNFLSFDEKGKINGVEGEMIHPFNKNESSVHGDPVYLDKLKSRHNVILMGDSLGDLQMADGLQNINAILRIGFLNKKIEEYLETYKDSFDIVLIDDQSVDAPNWILNKIIEQST